MTEHANTFLLVTILLFVTILLIFGMKLPYVQSSMIYSNYFAHAFRFSIERGMSQEPTNKARHFFVVYVQID